METIKFRDFAEWLCGKDSQSLVGMYMFTADDEEMSQETVDSVWDTDVTLSGITHVTFDNGQEDYEHWFVIDGIEYMAVATAPYPETGDE